MFKLKFKDLFNEQERGKKEESRDKTERKEKDQVVPEAFGCGCLWNDVSVYLEK